jgi:hypothetical protein
MRKSRNVATPATAATLIVPLRLSSPGLTPIAIVTVSVNVRTGFRNASRTVTSTAGVIGAPATVESGCTLKLNCVGVAAVTAKRSLVAAVSPLAVAASR